MPTAGSGCTGTAVSRWIRQAGTRVLTWSRASCRGPTLSVPAAGPELAVAGVAEPGQDVALLVEAAVERRAVDGHVRVGRADRRDALRRGDEVDQLDPARAPALEHLDRGRRGAARGEHRVEDQAEVDGRGVGQLVVVLDRPQGRSSRKSPRCQTSAVGISSSIASTMPRTGAQDRHEPDPVAELVGLDLLERGADAARSESRVGERLVAEEPRAPGRPRGTSSARSSRPGGSRACAGRRDGARPSGTVRGAGWWCRTRARTSGMEGGRPAGIALAAGRIRPRDPGIRAARKAGGGGVAEHRSGGPPRAQGPTPACSSRECTSTGTLRSDPDKMRLS